MEIVLGIVAIVFSVTAIAYSINILGEKRSNVITAKQAARIADKKKSARLEEAKIGAMRKIRTTAADGDTSVIGYTTSLTDEDVKELTEYLEGLGYTVRPTGVSSHLEVSWGDE